MKKFIAILTTFVILTCFASPKEEVWITGEVVGISDGDTITVLDDSKTQHKIRLYGIDAPEKKQDYGTQSKKCLSDMIFGKTVNVKVEEVDRYKREIGKVYLDTMFINVEMVKKGMAWHYVAYAKNDNALRDAEKTAKEKKMGLWEIDNPVAPWEFRKKK